MRAPPRGDVDIIIEPHDLEGGKKYEWREAMALLKEEGKRTFSKKEAHIICAYLDEVNAALESIGGDKLASYYWSSTEYNSHTAWFVNFNSGYIAYTSKYYSFIVRPCAAF